MNKAILLFSGGIDSSYTAVRSADKYDRLILITYRTPGMIKLHLAERTAGQIKNLFKDKIEHRTIDIRPSVSSYRGSIFKCIKDNIKYHFFYSWCLGCKLEMHLTTIDICLDEKITTVLDGSNFYDAHALEQNLECENFFKKLYADKGIDFVSPFYYESGKEVSGSNSFLTKIGLHKTPTSKKADYLRDLGIKLGSSFVSQYRSIQPSCTTSLLFNIPRAILKLFFKEEKEGYLDYLKDACVQHKK